MAKEKDEELELLKAQLAETQAQVRMLAQQQTSLTASQLETILQRNSESTQKALRPENERPPLMSVFNPLGDNITAKRPLKRKTFLNGHREHTSDSSLQADMLLQAEVDAYNDLGEAVEMQADKRLFARGELYKAELRNRGTELHVEVPVANLDTRSNLPPTLILLCHELRTGESMMDLNNLLAEVTRLRAEVERLGGPAAQVVKARSQSAPTMTGGGPLVKDLESALESTSTRSLAGA